MIRQYSVVGLTELLMKMKLTNITTNSFILIKYTALIKTNEQNPQTHRNDNETLTHINKETQNHCPEDYR